MMRRVSRPLAVILLAVLILGAGVASASDGLSWSSRGVLIEMPVQGVVKARIRACSDYPELILSVNRSNDSTCGLPATVDTPMLPSLSIQLRSHVDEKDIILYLDDSATPLHDAFLRVTPYGVIAATDQANVSTIGTVPPPPYKGLQVLGPDVRVTADWYEANAEQLGYNVFAVRGPDGMALWLLRLMPDGSLAWLDRTGVVRWQLAPP